MTYDFFIGKSSKIKDNPIIIGSLDFNEYPIIRSLLQRFECAFLSRISNLFSDQCFPLSAVEPAYLNLMDLLTQPLEPEERILLYKLIAITGYSLHVKEPLHGISPTNRY